MSTQDLISLIMAAVALLLHSPRVYGGLKAFARALARQPPKGG